MGKILRDRKGLERIGAELIAIVLVAVVFAGLFRYVPGTVQSLWNQVTTGISTLLTENGF